MDLVKLILSALAIAENAVVYNFVQRLIETKCVCSMDWRREAISAMTAFNFVLIMIRVLQPQQLPPISYSLLIGIYSLIYFTVVLTYTHGLFSSGCECSKGLDRTWIYITRVVDLALFSMLILLVILSR